jgi:protein-tyrosine-phosphatase
MLEHGVRLEGQYPKGIEMMVREPFDVVVNMSGEPLPRMNAARLLEWKVRDPIGRSDDVYQEVAEQIERLVKGLIAELRL